MCVCVSINPAEKFVEGMYVFIISQHGCILKVNEVIIVKMLCHLHCREYCLYSQLKEAESSESEQ